MIIDSDIYTKDSFKIAQEWVNKIKLTSDEATVDALAALLETVRMNSFKNGLHAEAKAQDTYWKIHLKNNHVAWLRYIREGERTRIIVCDSDALGAFQVYRGVNRETKDTWTPQPKVSKGVCEHCGTAIIDNCLRCGAPQCCPKCCAEVSK